MRLFRPTSDKYDTVYLNETDKIIANPQLKRFKNTVIYSFGWMENYSVEGTQLIVNAFLRTRRYNVLVLDWSDYSQGDYLKEVAQKSMEVILN